MAATAGLFRHGAVRCLLWAAGFLLVGWLLNGDAFLNSTNIRNILRQNSMLGLATLGMTLVMISGGVDLSVGGMVALCSAAAAFCSHRGDATAVAATLLLGMALGGINAFLVARRNMAPLIATLATMMAYRGIASLITGGQAAAVSPARDSWLPALGRGYVVGVPAPVLIFLLVAVLTHLFAVSTRPGRQIFAIGNNQAAAENVGIPVARVKATAYILSGLLCALAGLILASRMGAGQPLGTEGWEMNALAASVIGGAALSGGVGAVAGTVMGVMVVGSIANAINLHGGIDFYWESIVAGALLLGVLALRTYGKGAK